LPPAAYCVALVTDEGSRRLFRLRWAATHHVDVVLKLDRKRRLRQLDLDGFPAEIEEALNVRGYLLLVDNHTPGSVISNGISHMFVMHGINHRDGGHQSCRGRDGP